jgi:hypothetical protein
MTDERGPALDQEPMQVEVPPPNPPELAGSGLEPSHTLELTAKEFKAVSQTMALALFTYHPQCWIETPEADDTLRFIMAEMMMEYATRAMEALTLDEAKALKDKFKTIVVGILSAKGSSIEEEKEKLLTEIKRIRELVAGEIEGSLMPGPLDGTTSLDS